MNKTDIKIFLVLLIVFVVNQLSALELASITWDEFDKQSDFIGRARVVKAEIISYAHFYTFEIEEVFKGPDLKSVTLELNLMMDGPISKIGESGIIALKKVKKSWKFAVDGRSFWPVQYVMKPDYSTIIRVGVPDFLIMDFPQKLKKKFRIITLLLDGSYHEYKAALYLQEDVEKYLREIYR